jgi:hypothetical protein
LIDQEQKLPLPTLVLDDKTKYPVIGS